MPCALDGVRHDVQSRVVARPANRRQSGAFIAARTSHRTVVIRRGDECAADENPSGCRQTFGILCIFTLLNCAKCNQQHSDPSDLNLFTSADDVDDAFDSLLYGVSNLNTQLMLTVGRMKRDEELLRSDHFDSSLHSRRPTTFGGHKSPMLKLFYKRLAPKLDVYHELNIQLSPIFAMYDENALAGLGDFFSAVDGGGTEASVPTDGSDELEDAV